MASRWLDAAKVAPAANPVIADLRATPPPYRPKFTVMARPARCRSAMVLVFEAGWNFPPAAQNVPYRATRLAEPPDSPACLLPVEGCRAFAADNQPPLTEASCCWPAPDSRRSHCKWRPLIFFAIQNLQSTGFRHAPLESHLLLRQPEFWLSAGQRTGPV